MNGKIAAVAFICIGGLLAVVLMAHTINARDVVLRERWITLSNSVPGTFDRDCYQWITTNDILSAESGPDINCFIFSSRDGKTTELTRISNLLSGAFPEKQFAVFPHYPWLVAFNNSDDSSRAKAVLARVDSTNFTVLPWFSMFYLDFWSTTNIGWLAKVYTQPSGHTAFIEVTNNVIRKTDVTLPRGRFLGFGSDGKFLTVGTHQPDESFSEKGNTDLCRFDLRNGTNAESASEIEFRHPAAIFGHLSPKGDKILWCLELDRGTRFKLTDQWPFVSQEHFDRTEIWISDDFGRGLHEIGEFAHQENVVPKWLPDEKHFSLLISNFIRIIPAE